MKLLLSAILFGVLSLVNGQYNYAEVIQKSILFYEAQRSGYLPPNNRIDYRGDSALTDGNDVGVDLLGGWYDAGDHVKFNFPMAWSVTTLAWGILEFRSAYEQIGELNNALDSIKWPLDYLLKCHTSGTTFYAQVGDGNADHAVWGRPEEMTIARPSSVINAGAPGSDLAAETAAAMAASSLVFRPTNAAYADTLLSNARSLFDFAYNNRGIYSNSINNGGFYGSSGFNDELAWGAIWLHRATGEQLYLDRAIEFYNDGTPWAYDWDNKYAGVQVLLYKATQNAQYSSAVERFIRSWLPGGGIHYTPLGLAWRAPWGSLRYAAGTALVALVAANEGILVNEGRDFAIAQLHYALGDSGRSYVVGFGNNPPERPHHRSSSCPDLPAPCDWNDFNNPGPNPQVLNGALVGGPGMNDEFVDDRTDYISNEVATDYNAAIQGALAGLISLQMGGKL